MNISLKNVLLWAHFFLLKNSTYQNSEISCQKIGLILVNNVLQKLDYQWPKLCVGLDEEADIQILKGI